MASTSDIRKGLCIKYNNDIYLELKKIKHKLTIKIRKEALNQNYGKKHKKKIK